MIHGYHVNTQDIKKRQVQICTIFFQHQHNNQNKLLNDMNTGMAVIDKYTCL